MSIIPGATGLTFPLDGKLRVVRVRDGLFVEPQYGWDETIEYQAVGYFQAPASTATPVASGQRVATNVNSTGENITNLFTLTILRLIFHQYLTKI